MNVSEDGARSTRNAITGITNVPHNFCTFFTRYTLPPYSILVIGFAIFETRDLVLCITNLQMYAKSLYK